MSWQQLTMTHYESCCAWPDMVIYSHVKERATIQLYITYSWKFHFHVWKAAMLWLCISMVTIPECSFLMLETTLEYGCMLSWRWFWVLLSKGLIGKVSEICNLSWLTVTYAMQGHMVRPATLSCGSLWLICTHAVQGHMLTSLSNA